jgi:hypothetical protein
MTSNFQLSKIKTLSPVDAKDYITKYFVPLSNGNHAMLIDGVYTIKDDQEIKRSYFNRMQKELCNYYFKEFTEVKTIAYEINKPTFYDDKINLCPPMLYQYNEEYKPTKQVQEKLNFLLNYMKEILCSNKQDCYDFLLKWVSNMLKGNKNNSCLYLKGIQGVGKSSLFVFLSKYVIGQNLGIETGSDPIRTKFNEILGGKLLVCIEELENFSKAEWESISSTLKRMITSPNITLQNKCTKAYESNNINNYILCSNNDAIKDDDGRRYFILDIATHKVGDHAYYHKLYNECFTKEVGEAFFHEIYKININNFNPQSFPITQSKLDSLSKRLDSVYKFIKEEYVLKNLDLDLSATELYTEYKYSTTYKAVTKEDFHRKLNEVGLTKTKKDGKLWYEIPHKTLAKCAKSKMWLHELDEYEEEEQEEEPVVKVKKTKSKYDNKYIISPLDE